MWNGKSPNYQSIVTMKTDGNYMSEKCGIGYCTGRSVFQIYQMADIQVAASAGTTR
jgi:hypothetical protein